MSLPRALRSIALACSGVHGFLFQSIKVGEGFLFHFAAHEIVAQGHGIASQLLGDTLGRTSKLSEWNSRR